VKFPVPTPNDTSELTLFLEVCQLHYVACCVGYRPEELEALVCGGRVLDMEALQANVRYDDGYNERSRIIQWFWEVGGGGGEGKGVDKCTGGA
jgi:hypothetical protein